MDLMDSAAKDSRVWSPRGPADPEAEALQAELSRREALLVARLQAKAEAEEKAKGERQQKAKAELKEYIEGWRRGLLQQRRQTDTPPGEESGAAERSPAEAWKYMALAVSQRDSEYLGQKSVGRMKTAILNHAAHLEAEGP